MNEREFDSSVNEYEEQYKSNNYIKQLQWDMAIGLQEVDNLKPSKYLEKLLEEEVKGNLTIEELEKNYREMNIVKVINNITKFSSSIWQVHPFREGNTRTTVLFIEKYLISLGYILDNTLFKDKSIYFRNDLVRNNYFNNYLNIKEDSSYLVKFYENLLLGKNNNLHSRDLIVQELFDKK